MTNRLSRLVAALSLLLLPAVAAGCGGPAEEGDAAAERRRRQALARRLLDAEGGLRGADPGLPEDDRGQGRELRPVLRRVRRPVARGGQRPARRHRRALAGARRRQARRARARRRQLGRHADRRLRHQLGRRVRRPQGQPEEHQDVGRHRQGGRRDHHAEPVHLRRRQVEPDGRLRLADRAGQVARGGGLEFLHEVLANTPVQDKSAREALQTFAGGKGDVLLAYENEAITAQKAGDRARLRGPGRRRS